ncbi:MAG: BMC domain-containing protein [bacterium]|nr:BMC domain-containing protein [bacterium]
MSTITTLGLVELNSVAKGILTCDTMVKKADVELIEAYPVCPGKYVIIISGDVAAVENAVHAGIAAAESNFIDQMVLPRVHDQIIPGLLGTSQILDIQAIGILETFSVASTLIAADTSLKASHVHILEIRLAKGLGGKSFFTITGTVANVTAAIEAGSHIIAKDGILVNKEIIPDPHPSLKQQLLEW